MWQWALATVLLTMIGMVGSLAQELAIESFDATGQLKFNEVPKAETYRVEWASAPDGPWGNFTNAADAALNEMPPSGNGTIICSVPMTHSECMFFRTVALMSTSPAGMTQIPDGTQTGTNPDTDLGSYNLTVSAFHIDKYEVTLALWNKVHTWAITNGYVFDNVGTGKADNHPVHTVNWYDAIKWCNARSEMEGRPPVYTFKGAVYRSDQKGNVVQSSAAGYRLPTTTEWEYAARGNTETPYFFPGKPKDFSDLGFWRKFFPAKTDNITAYVIYEKNSYNRSQEPDMVEANPFGLKNMLGNVMEYTADRYDAEAYSKRADGAKDPIVTQGEEWVIRGGNYASDASEVRSATRSHTNHDEWMKTDPQQPKSIWWYSDYKGIGFRVVCEADGLAPNN